MATFTADDVGKTVETANGEALGAVVSVDDETAYVDPNPGLADSTRAALDWQGDAEAAVPLTDDAVAEVTDEAVRLEAEVPEESITSAETDDSDGGDRSEPSAEGPVDHSPGEPVASNPTEPERDVDATDPGAGTSPLEGDEPMVEDDEFYDAAEGGARVDPSDEMEPPTGDEEAPSEDVEAIEDEASRELEVDPTEVADDPEAEIEPGEDVGNRTGTDATPDRERAGSDEGPTTEDAGAIDAEIPTASEDRPEGVDADEDEMDGEEHDLDEGR